MEVSEFNQIQVGNLIAVKFRHSYTDYSKQDRPTVTTIRGTLGIVKDITDSKVDGKGLDVEVESKDGLHTLKILQKDLLGVNILV